CGSILRPAAALLALAACAPKQNTHGLEPLSLDCSQPFAAQAERITGQPGLKAAPKDPNEPYRYYSTEDGATSYLVTLPDAAGLQTRPAGRLHRARPAAQHERLGERRGAGRLRLPLGASGGLSPAGRLVRGAGAGGLCAVVDSGGRPALAA